MAILTLKSISEGSEFFNLFYVAISVENILYGIELFLYFQTMRILLSNKGAPKKIKLFYALFSTAMVFLVTVWVATQALFGQNMWLLDSDFPGGQSAYWKKYIAIWYVDWGATAIIVLQFMTDALMIYRCRIIWESNRVVIVPILLWLAAVPLGVSVDWSTSSPGGDYFTGVSIQLSLAYWSVSVFLSMILTSMICYRMVRHGKMVQAQLGNEHASVYFSLASIVIESVLPYTLSGICVLVSLGANSPTAVIFVSVYFMMMCISPQMLILRVVSGEARNRSSFSRPSSIINFSPSDKGESGSRWSDNDEVTHV